MNWASSFVIGLFIIMLLLYFYWDGLGIYLLGEVVRGYNEEELGEDKKKA